MVYTFVKGSLETVVWNPKKRSALAEFSRGLFKTKDESVALKLRELGYKEITDFPDGPPKEGFEPKPSDLPDLNAGDPNVNIMPPKTETAALLKSQVVEPDASELATGPEDEDDNLDDVEI
jgi:hypothetical protein